MAIKIGSNFAYNGKLPNFERDSFETKAAMKAFDENSIDEGHLSYCEEDGNVYQYKSANTVDTTTGRWRIFKTDIVVDAALNGTSKNPIQNKAVFNALKLKADTAALAAYQPKYEADYIATSDLSTLPITTGVINLNGYQINVPNINSTDGDLTIRNGFVVFDTNIINLKINSITFDNVTILCSDDTQISLNIENLKCINVVNPPAADIDFLTEGSVIKNVTLINSSIISTLPVTDLVDATNSLCYIKGNVVLNAYNSYIGGSDFLLAGGSSWDNTSVSASYYNSGRFFTEKITCTMGFDKNIIADSDYAPQTKAVYDALQLKADKTQLNDLATKTELNSKADASALNSYLTKTDAGNTYAKKSDITNIYKFKGTKTNYTDLPTTNRVTGDVWNITNADAEHGIKAGDNVAWNGTEWDNLSGIVDLSAYATTSTTDAISADVKKLMDKAFPFTVNVSIDKILAKKGTSQPVKVTITPKIGDDNTNVDEIMINGAEHHGATPYVYSATATTTTTYNVRASKGDRTAQGSATITFVNPSYDGVVAANFTATEANIKTLTETLRSGKGGTRTFNLNNQKACIAYPKAFGAATGIKDINGFDYLASYTRSELNVNGELYYVYLLTNATTITDFKQTIS